jgi:hypothetical protein
MTDVGEGKGPFGGSSHCSASAEDVWAVWTNPAEWPGDVVAMAKIGGPFAGRGKITTRVKATRRCHRPSPESNRRQARFAAPTTRSLPNAFAELTIDVRRGQHGLRALVPKSRSRLGW